MSDRVPRELKQADSLERNGDGDQSEFLAPELEAKLAVRVSLDVPAEVLIVYQERVYVVQRQCNGLPRCGVSCSNQRDCADERTETDDGKDQHGPNSNRSVRRA